MSHASHLFCASKFFRLQLRHQDESNNRYRTDMRKYDIDKEQLMLLFGYIYTQKMSSLGLFDVSHSTTPLMMYQIKDMILEKDFAMHFMQQFALSLNPDTIRQMADLTWTLRLPAAKHGIFAFYIESTGTTKNITWHGVTIEMGVEVWKGLWVLHFHWTRGREMREARGVWGCDGVRGRGAGVEGVMCFIWIIWTTQNFYIHPPPSDINMYMTHNLFEPHPACMSLVVSKPPSPPVFNPHSPCLDPHSPCMNPPTYISLASSRPHYLQTSPIQIYNPKPDHLNTDPLFLIAYPLCKAPAVLKPKSTPIPSPSSSLNTNQLEHHSV